LGRGDLKGRGWLHNAATIFTLGFVEIKYGLKKRGKRGRIDLVLK
jgi:hypothetical protein